MASHDNGCLVRVDIHPRQTVLKILESLGSQRVSSYLNFPLNALIRTSCIIPLR